MDEKIHLPSREYAETILKKAHEQNPGPWLKHSQTVARIAETIAKASGLDAHRAFVSGLLHDVGRYEGYRGLHHVYAGYEIMKSKGFDLIAEICLSHSFPYQDIGAYSGGNYDCTQEELNVIVFFLANKVFNDYDKLIQLSDSMGTVNGTCLIDVRILDVVRRYGFDEFTLKKWDSIFALKKYFDELCKMNTYDLFYDEIRKVSFS